MAVLSCKLIAEGRSSRFGLENKNEHSRRYRIRTDNAMDSGFVVLTGAYTASPHPLPTRYSYYTDSSGTDLSTYCTEVSLEQDSNDRKTWIATASFGTLPPGKNPTDAAYDNPILRPPRYRVDFQEESTVVAKDNAGAAIVNSVGDEFDEPLEQEEIYPILVVERNYANLQTVIDIGNEYHKSVNSKVFYGSAVRTVRFLPLTSTELLFENGVSFYTVTFRFMFNKDTWDRVVMNRGWRYRQAAGGNLIPAVDPTTQLPVQSPVKLAANGTLLADGAQPIWLTYQTRPLKDFSSLGV